LRALGVRPGPSGPRHGSAGGWESLTATERAASLVADGLTNGAVARRLSISPHIVTPTCGTCSPSWACRTGLRSPPWYITRSSDVFAAGRQHHRSCAVRCFAIRLLPGQAEPVQIALASCWSGARKEAYQDGRRRAAIIREAVWIQPAPGGDAAVVYLEADDLATALTILGTSAEPFDRWFRDHARQVHGIAWEEEFTAPELVLDFDTSRI
jgi:hypothetical protein